MFAAMGADRFAELAAAELRAIGERARARTRRPRSISRLRKRG
jgi:hypothetical protein